MRVTWHLVAGLALVVCCSWFCAAQDGEVGSKLEKSNEPKLFRVLNFQKFKQLFGKHYKSLVEEMSRMRLFLSKYLRAFVSVIRYKKGQATSYKSINKMSDWTDEEYRETLMKPEVLRAIKEGRKVDEKQASENKDELLRSAAERDTVGVDGEEHARRKLIEASQNLDNAQADDESLSELKGESVERSGNRDVLATRRELNAASPEGRMSKSERPERLEARQGPKRAIAPVMSGEMTSAMLGDDDDAEGSRVMTRTMMRNIRDGADGLLVDHRFCMGEPYDQGRCGSCYIFATIAALEYHYCKSTGKIRKFSEQYPLDCAKSGCGGGYPKDVIDFSVKDGLERSQAWPYFERRKKCPLKRPIELNSGISGYWRVTGLERRNVELNDFDEEIFNGPIIASILLSSDFHEYGGGVDQPACHDPEAELHCMLIVGQGHENGLDYWLIRNSHGSYWGEDGYYKIAKESFAECYVHDSVDNGLLIEGDFRFRKNRSYNNALIKKYTARWQARLAMREPREYEDDLDENRT